MRHDTAYMDGLIRVGITYLPQAHEGVRWHVLQVAKAMHPRAVLSQHDLRRCLRPGCVQVRTPALAGAISAGSRSVVLELWTDLHVIRPDPLHPHLKARCLGMNGSKLLEKSHKVHLPTGMPSCLCTAS